MSLQCFGSIIVRLFFVCFTSFFCNYFVEAEKLVICKKRKLRVFLSSKWALRLKIGPFKKSRFKLKEPNIFYPLLRKIWKNLKIHISKNMTPVILKAIGMLYLCLYIFFFDTKVMQCGIWYYRTFDIFGHFYCIT